MRPAVSLVRTSLPLPYCQVGGVFMAYAEKPDGMGCFCACTREAIGHYVQSELAEKSEREARRGLRPQGRYDFVINHSFPEAVADALWAQQPDNDGILERLRFRENICHRCWRAVPPYENLQSRSYFENVFRLLIYRELHALGFSFIAHPLPYVSTPWHGQLLPANFEALMTEVRRLSVEIYGTPTQPPRWRLESGPEYARAWRRSQEVQKEIEAATRTVREFAVSRLRAHYEFPAFKAWLQRETVLFLNVRSIFRPCAVERHAKPDFLDGLELDIWVPDRRLGVEFQGAQHSRAFDYLGGAKALAAVQERDRRKASLCARHGVRLVCFDEADDLNENRVAEKLGLG